MTSPMRMTSRILFLPFLWCSFLYAPVVFAGEIARHEAAPSRQAISVVTSAEADSPHVVPVPNAQPVPIAGRVPPPAVRFFTINPCRLIDTRRPAGSYGGPALQAGTQRDFAIDGQCGIPADALAVSANITTVNPSARGDLRAYPAGAPVPSSSVINFNAGQTRANNAIVPLMGSPIGSMTIQTDITGGGTTHFLFDVNGYFKFVSN